jgi:LmbE family N-acetylglucosaminyl deacetylase
VRVVVATDGDNNPWPQRWLERRWFIGAEARNRWGARRREESRDALRQLGVPADAMRFLGWPDQGLTDKLMRDAQAIDVLADQVAEFSPTMIALPALADRHPDHSALCLMLEVALHSQGRSGLRRLKYLVHGCATPGTGFGLSLDEQRRQVKRLALLAHATQLSLSRRRMQRLCERVERFESSAPERPFPASTRSLRWAMPAPVGLRRLQRHELLLVLGFSDRVERWRVPLRRVAAPMAWASDVARDQGVNVDVEPAQGHLGISLESRESLQFAFAKIERTGNRLLIYDADGWHDITDPANRR